MNFELHLPRNPVSSLVWLLWLSLTLTLQAHDPGLSTVDVRLKRDAIDIVLVLSVKDLRQLEKWDQSGVAPIADLRNRNQ
jgi:hypothetical protein